MNLKFTLLFCCMLCTTFLFGQSFCGLSPSDVLLIQERLVANKTALNDGLLIERDVVTYIPIKYHRIGDDDGKGQLPVRSLLNAHCKLNETYAPYEIQFFIHEGFNEINNSLIYEDPGAYPELLEAERDLQAINVFIAKNATANPPIPEGITLGYYTPINDWIVLRKSVMTSSDFTLSHQIGHFFSLIHTFSGWECNLIQDDIIDPNTGCVYPDACNTIPEKMDGSNCEITGDFICDTPPDYGLHSSNNLNCEYTGDVCDPCGVQIEPMADNLMSYFECDNYVLTPQQVEVILADYASPERAYLINVFPPTVLPISEGVTLTSPSTNQVTPTFSYVEFDWEDTENASHYLFELDIVQFFTIEPRRRVVSVSEWGEFDLSPNTTYYWRVRPFNYYYTCIDNNEVGVFQTSGLQSNTKELPNLQNWSIFPSPTTKTQNFSINIEANNIFVVDLKIRDTQGRLVFSKNQWNIREDDHQLSISSNSFPTGLYFISLQTEYGISTKRLIITD